ncbi:hypothetical protein PSQ90_14780 [Devosia rhodophyticola]|uniref:Curlin associated repeat-containing protein n=1 Tax=Devosia rhodophyticola TaxID=3026423 RepID=A0ABY7YWA2_9HYPH|nr:hypothetical protein [Devosia rhodophyticola]WDR05524.1 hypothetical protein PSQ90_14780 [Devosia rhodophyticola]
MTKTFAVLVLLGAGFFGQAHASDALYITADYHSSANRNIANVSLLGDSNAFSIDQTFTGLGSVNSLSLDIIGDLNGGPLNTAFAPALASIGLQPGQIVQYGNANAMSVTLHGASNLFAAAQVGSNNMLTAMVVGNNNQSSVSQSGTGNSLSFTQNGNGNSLTVVQRAY